KSQKQAEVLLRQPRGSIDAPACSGEWYELHARRRSRRCRSVSLPNVGVTNASHARLPMRSRDAIAKPHPARRYDRPLHVNGLAELMKPPHRRGHKWSALAVDGTPLPVVSFSFLSAKCVA